MRAHTEQWVTSLMNITEFQHTVRSEMYAYNYFLIITRTIKLISINFLFSSPYVFYLKYVCYDKYLVCNA